MDRQFPIGKLSFSEDYTSIQLKTWIKEIEEFPELLRREIAKCSEKDLDTPYREGGWTVKQVVEHVLDSHLNAIIRLKLALTEQNPEIRPYEQNAWVELERKFNTPIELTLSMLEDCHAKMVLIYKSLNKEDWKKSYVNPESGRYTLAKSAALYAWHSKHHLAHIRLVTKNL